MNILQNQTPIHDNLYNSLPFSLIIKVMERILTRPNKDEKKHVLKHFLREVTNKIDQAIDTQLRSQHIPSNDPFVQSEQAPLEHTFACPDPRLLLLLLFPALETREYGVKEKTLAQIVTKCLMIGPHTENYRELSQKAHRFVGDLGDMVYRALRAFPVPPARNTRDARLTIFDVNQLLDMLVRAHSFDQKKEVFDLVFCGGTYMMNDDISQRSSSPSSSQTRIIRQMTPLEARAFIDIVLKEPLYGLKGSFSHSFLGEVLYDFYLKHYGGTALQRPREQLQVQFKQFNFASKSHLLYWTFSSRPPPPELFESIELSVKIEPGIHTSAMLASGIHSFYLTATEDKKLPKESFIIQDKFDGERIFVHLLSPSSPYYIPGQQQFCLFSRRGTNQRNFYSKPFEQFVYPYLKGLENVILDGELVSYKTKTRKYAPVYTNKVVSRSGPDAAGGAVATGAQGGAYNRHQQQFNYQTGVMELPPDPQDNLSGAAARRHPDQARASDITTVRDVFDDVIYSDDDDDDDNGDGDDGYGHGGGGADSIQLASKDEMKNDDTILDLSLTGDVHDYILVYRVFDILYCHGDLTHLSYVERRAILLALIGPREKHPELCICTDTLVINNTIAIDLNNTMTVNTYTPSESLMALSRTARVSAANDRIPQSYISTTDTPYTNINAYLHPRLHILNQLSSMGAATATATATATAGDASSGSKLLAPDAEYDVVSMLTSDNGLQKPHHHHLTPGSQPPTPEEMVKSLGDLLPPTAQSSVFCYKDPEHTGHECSYCVGVCKFCITSSIPLHHLEQINQHHQFKADGYHDQQQQQQQFAGPAGTTGGPHPQRRYDQYILHAPYVGIPRKVDFIQQRFNCSLIRGLEGVVVKRFCDPYVIGSRSQWTKIKPYDTIDAVLIGGSETSAEYARGRLGRFCLAVIDEHRSYQAQEDSRRMAMGRMYSPEPFRGIQSIAREYLRFTEIASIASGFGEKNLNIIHDKWHNRLIQLDKHTPLPPWLVAARRNRLTHVIDDVTRDPIIISLHVTSYNVSYSRLKVDPNDHPIGPFAPVPGQGLLAHTTGTTSTPHYQQQHPPGLKPRPQYIASIALREPRFDRFRDDKSIHEIETTTSIKERYDSQRQRLNGNDLESALQFITKLISTTLDSSQAQTAAQTGRDVLARGGAGNGTPAVGSGTVTTYTNASGIVTIRPYYEPLRIRQLIINANVVLGLSVNFQLYQSYVYTVTKSLADRAKAHQQQQQQKALLTAPVNTESGLDPRRKDASVPSGRAATEHQKPLPSHPAKNGRTTATATTPSKNSPFKLTPSKRPHASAGGTHSLDNYKPRKLMLDLDDAYQGLAELGDTVTAKHMEKSNLLMKSHSTLHKTSFDMGSLQQSFDADEMEHVKEEEVYRPLRSYAETTTTTTTTSSNIIAAAADVNIKLTSGGNQQPRQIEGSRGVPLASSYHHEYQPPATRDALMTRTVNSSTAVHVNDGRDVGCVATSITTTATTTTATNPAIVKSIMVDVNVSSTSSLIPPIPGFDEPDGQFEEQFQSSTLAASTGKNIDRAADHLSAAVQPTSHQGAHLLGHVAAAVFMAPAESPGRGQSVGQEPTQSAHPPQQASTSTMNQNQNRSKVPDAEGVSSRSGDSGEIITVSVKKPDFSSFLSATTGKKPTKGRLQIKAEPSEGGQPTQPQSNDPLIKQERNGPNSLVKTEYGDGKADNTSRHDAHHQGSSSRQASTPSLTMLFHADFSTHINTNSLFLQLSGKFKSSISDVHATALSLLRPRVETLMQYGTQHASHGFTGLGGAGVHDQPTTDAVIQTYEAATLSEPSALDRLYYELTPISPANPFHTVPPSRVHTVDDYVPGQAITTGSSDPYRILQRRANQHEYDTELLRDLLFYIPLGCTLYVPQGVQLDTNTHQHQSKTMTTAFAGGMRSTTPSARCILTIDRTTHPYFDDNISHSRYVYLGGTTDVQGPRLLQNQSQKKRKRKSKGNKYSSKEDNPFFFLDYDEKTAQHQQQQHAVNVSTDDSGGNAYSSSSYTAPSARQGIQGMPPTGTRPGNLPSNISGPTRNQQPARIWDSVDYSSLFSDSYLATKRRREQSALDPASLEQSLVYLQSDNNMLRSHDASQHQQSGALGIYSSGFHDTHSFVSNPMLQAIFSPVSTSTQSQCSTSSDGLGREDVFTLPHGNTHALPTTMAMGGLVSNTTQSQHTGTSSSSTPPPPLNPSQLTPEWWINVLETYAYPNSSALPLHVTPYLQGAKWTRSQPVSFTPEQMTSLITQYGGHTMSTSPHLYTFKQYKKMYAKAYPSSNTVPKRPQEQLYIILAETTKSTSIDNIIRKYMLDVEDLRSRVPSGEGFTNGVDGLDEILSHLVVVHPQWLMAMLVNGIVGVKQSNINELFQTLFRGTTQPSRQSVSRLFIDNRYVLWSSYDAIQVAYFPLRQSPFSLTSGMGNRGNESNPSNTTTTAAAPGTNLSASIPTTVNDKGALNSDNPNEQDTIPQPCFDTESQLVNFLLLVSFDANYSCDYDALVPLVHDTPTDEGSANTGGGSTKSIQNPPQSVHIDTLGSIESVLPATILSTTLIMTYIPPGDDGPADANTNNTLASHSSNGVNSATISAFKETVRYYHQNDPSRVDVSKPLDNYTFSSITTLADQPQATNEPQHDQSAEGYTLGRSPTMMMPHQTIQPIYALAKVKWSLHLVVHAIVQFKNTLIKTKQSVSHSLLNAVIGSRNRTKLTPYTSSTRPGTTNTGEKSISTSVSPLSACYHATGVVTLPISSYLDCFYEYQLTDSILSTTSMLAFLSTTMYQLLTRLAISTIHHCHDHCLELSSSSASAASSSSFSIAGGEDYTHRQGYQHHQQGDVKMEHPSASTPSIPSRTTPPIADDGDIYNQQLMHHPSDRLATSSPSTGTSTRTSSRSMLLARLSTTHHTEYELEQLDLETDGIQMSTPQPLGQQIGRGNSHGSVVSVQSTTSNASSGSNDSSTGRRLANMKPYYVYTILNTLHMAVKREYLGMVSAFTQQHTTLNSILSASIAADSTTTSTTSSASTYNHNSIQSGVNTASTTLFRKICLQIDVLFTQLDYLHGALLSNLTTARSKRGGGGIGPHPSSMGSQLPCLCIFISSITTILVTITTLLHLSQSIIRVDCNDPATYLGFKPPSDGGQFPPGISTAEGSEGILQPTVQKASTLSSSKIQQLVNNLTPFTTLQYDTPHTLPFTLQFYLKLLQSSLFSAHDINQPRQQQQQQQVLVPNLGQTPRKSHRRSGSSTTTLTADLTKSSETEPHHTPTTSLFFFDITRIHLVNLMAFRAPLSSPPQQHRLIPSTLPIHIDYSKKRLVSCAVFQFNVEVPPKEFDISSFRSANASDIKIMMSVVDPSLPSALLRVHMASSLYLYAFTKTFLSDPLVKPPSATGIPLTSKNFTLLPSYALSDAIKTTDNSTADFASAFHTVFQRPPGYSGASLNYPKIVEALMFYLSSCLAVTPKQRSLAPPTKPTVSSPVKRRGIASSNQHDLDRKPVISSHRKPSTPPKAKQSASQTTAFPSYVTAPKTMVLQFPAMPRYLIPRVSVGISRAVISSPTVNMIFDAILFASPLNNAHLLSPLVQPGDLLSSHLMAFDTSIGQSSSSHRDEFVNKLTRLFPVFSAPSLAASTASSTSPGTSSAPPESLAAESQMVATSQTPHAHMNTYGEQKTLQNHVHPYISQLLANFPPFLTTSQSVLHYACLLTTSHLKLSSISAHTSSSISPYPSLPPHRFLFFPFPGNTMLFQTIIDMFSFFSSEADQRHAPQQSSLDMSEDDHHLHPHQMMHQLYPGIGMACESIPLLQQQHGGETDRLGKRSNRHDSITRAKTRRGSQHLEPIPPPVSDIATTTLVHSPLVVLPTGRVDDISQVMSRLADFSDDMDVSEFVSTHSSTHATDGDSCGCLLCHMYFIFEQYRTDVVIDTSVLPTSPAGCTTSNTTNNNTPLSQYQSVFDKLVHRLHTITDQFVTKYSSHITSSIASSFYQQQFVLDQGAGDPLSSHATSKRRISIALAQHHIAHMKLKLKSLFSSMFQLQLYEDAIPAILSQLLPPETAQ